MKHSLGFAAAVLVAVATAIAGTNEGTLPKPGVGVFFKAEETPRLREKIQRPPCQGIY